MAEEPTLLSQILCVVFCLFITGGFIFFLCLINVLLDKLKGICMVEGGSTFVGDREHRWMK